jgi:hypothetical protein
MKAAVKAGIAPYAVTNLNVCKRRENSTITIINRYLIKQFCDTMDIISKSDCCNDADQH